MAIIGRLDIITNEGYIEEALEQCEYEGLNKEQTALEIKKIIDEVVKLVSKNESLQLVSSSLRIEDFHIGFEYLQYEMDSERYLNKGMIWKKKKYGFDSPRLHKIKELIDNGEIARCNES